jgi:hypothetical protein
MMDACARQGVPSFAAEVGRHSAAHGPQNLPPA